MNSRRSKTNIQAVQSELTCPLCGRPGITTSWNPLVFNYGPEESTVELTVYGPVRRCEDCEFEYLDEEAERLKHEAVCRHLGVLSPAEVRRIREGFDMTRAKFAQLTGLGEATLNRWENGLSVQTHAYDRYLRLLTRPGNKRVLEELVDSDNPSQTSILPKMQFRVLEVTDNWRKEQESFHLLKVA